MRVGGEFVDGPSAARGMLFQTPMLFPWLTTKKNVLFGPKAQRSAGLNERDDPELDADADFALGAAAGIVLGAAMSATRVARHLIDPVIEVLRPLPPLAFIPLFIIWFGIGELPKEVLIVIGVAPIMAVTTVAALDQVPEDLRLCARTLGASPLFDLLHVQVRAALPWIITGMRISMAGAWTSTVAVELSKRG